MSKDTLYDFEVKKNDGGSFSFAGLENKTIHIVNTASKCGFTPQYKGLEALHKKYGSKGLVVLGFPCDQFAHKEPGDAEAIKSFCELNYGVTFPLMAKIEVNGPNAHPFFIELRKRADGVLSDAIKWNFSKFLITPGAKSVKRYAPTTEPEKLEKDIEEGLVS
ncbi:MAG: glutathione peroxidase [Spirochaetes bacterium]|nr:glutathione peroxidase [Spirochaetota bacterium]